MNAVMLLNFGEPETVSLEEIVPFLERIFAVNAGLEGDAGAARARELAERRAPGLMEEYAHIGGSPLNRQARAQAGFLEDALRARGHDVRTYVGTQFSTPSIREAAEAARADGATCVIGIPMYPTCGPSTTVAALADLARAIDDMSWAVDYHEISAWDADPRYIELRADGIREACRQGGVQLDAPGTRLVFSAHGTPLKYLREGSRYDVYTMETCAQVAAAAGAMNYVLGYQNHSNRPIEWTQPAIDDAVRAITNATDLVVVPISFLHDQSETLAELDIELREIVEELGMRFHRVPVPHGDERLTTILADAVQPFLGDPPAASAGFAPCRCRATPRTWCRNAALRTPVET